MHFNHFIFFKFREFLTFPMAGSDHAILDLHNNDLEFNDYDYNKVCLQCTFCLFYLLLIALVSDCKDCIFLVI